MNIVKTVAVSFACIYAFHAFPSVKEGVVNFFDNTVENILHSDKRMDALDVISDTLIPVRPDPTPWPTATPVIVEHDGP